MTNELQIRLTADIKQFQAAMSTAESKLERAQNILSKAQTSADRYRGALATLAGQLKRGTVSQEEYNRKADKLSDNLLKQQDIINNSTREVSRLNNEFNRLKVANQASGAVNKLSGNVQGLQTNIRGANGVAIEFSRIIQDAPFGLMGVGNNLQQLTANFANLRKQSTSTGAAVKSALGAMFTGSNLLVLGISAVTAAFTAYQMGAFRSKETTESLQESLEKYKNTLDSVQIAQIEGIKNSGAEIVKINSLRKIIEDETSGRKERNNAIDVLIDKYPTLFEGLTREEILAGKVGEAYDKITKSLIARATAESSINKVVSLDEQRDLLLDQNKDKLEDIEAIRKRIAEFEEKRNKAILDGQNAEDKGEKHLALLRQTSAENQIRFLRNNNKEVDQLLTIEEQRAKLLGTITESLKESNTEIKKTKQELTKISELEITISDIFNEKDMFEQGELIKKAVKKGIISEKGAEDIKKLIADAINFANNEDIEKSIQESLSKSIEGATSRINTGDKPVSIPIAVELVEPESLISNFIKGVKDRMLSLDEFKQAIKDTGLTSEQFFEAMEAGALKSLKGYDGFIQKFTETAKAIDSANAMIERSVENTIGDISISMGEALTNGGNALEAGGAALLGGLASVLSQLGQLAISAGVTIEAIKKSFINFGGVGAIAAGVLLMGLAGAVGARAKAIGKQGFSGGGVSSMSAGPPQNFGNNFGGGAQLTNPVPRGLGSFGMNDRKLEAVVTGDQIRFVLTQSERRRGRG